MDLAHFKTLSTMVFFASILLLTPDFSVAQNKSDPYILQSQGDFIGSLAAFELTFDTTDDIEKSFASQMGGLMLASN